MVKYYLTYKGIDGDIFLFEILEEGFEGEATEIHGYVDHDYAARKDLIQYSVASSLDVKLEASIDFNLQDLYTEEESKFKCSLKRNNQTIFYGILKPDGIWEDFTTTLWMISMDAMDGLSILKDLSFVKDDGTFYIGKITQFDAVKQCLKRIGYVLPINISADLPVYDGFSGTDTILKSVQMNADRFYQDAQKNNIMDCEAVLKSVLEPYNATVIQMNGEWWIFRSIDVKNEMNFYHYDGEVKTDIVWNAELNIGSHIDQYEIFHANENQKKSINPSTQAFRVNYKYGTVKTISENPYIEAPYDGWTIDFFGGKVIPNGDRGLIIIDEFDDTDVGLITSNQTINLTTGDSVDVVFKFETSRAKPLFFGEFKHNMLIYSFETPNYWLTDAGWVLKSSLPDNRQVRDYGSEKQFITETFSLPPALEDGDLVIYVRIKDISFFPIPNNLFYFNSIEVIPNIRSNYKGEFHTAQRLTRISSVTKSDKTVSVGDSLSDIYYGTLYKADGEPTELWPTKPLLQLMVEDTLRIAPRPMYFFEGDFCGYFPYLANVLINNVPGKYQISKYSYDTKANVNRTNFREFDNVVLIQNTDYRYEFEYDYGTETKVTIKS